MRWSQVQERLKSLGFDPGKIDGIFGPDTRGALMRFQTSRQIVASGQMNEATLTALFGAGLDEQAMAPPWYEEAMRALGTQEVAGPRSNPIILDWAEEAGIPYDGDDIPWCGLFVAYCIARGAPDDPQPNSPLGARQWLKFGVACQPVRGAVMVFWRGTKDGWLGHVGFYAGEDQTTYHILGGNQSDRVSIVRIAKSRLLGARWPKSVAVYGGKVALAGDTPLSAKED